VATVSTVGTPATVSFVVPTSALPGLTGQRIRTRGNPNGSADACANFGSGETRDYTVTIGSASTTADDPSPYCAPISVAGCGTGNITNVALGGTTLNNSSGCAINTGGCLYARYPSTGNTTATVNRGTTYSISVTVDDNSAIVSAWADWNNNLVFETTEWVQVATNSAVGVPATVSLTVSTTAVSGAVRLRVRSRQAGNQNGLTDACLQFGSGETEDYTITVGCLTTPSAPTATGGSRCGSGSVVLTASGAPTGSSYRWYTVATGGTSIAGATAATYTTPTISATTVYYVSAVNSTGCESTTRTSVTATITPLPVATLTASGPLGFCSGGSVTLTAGGGTIGTTYQFTRGGGAFGAVTTTPTLVVNQSGVYGVTITNLGVGCTASSSTVNVTVYPAAVANAGPAASFCSGGSATLGAAAIAGTTYQWSPSTGLSSATASNPTVTLTNTTGAPINNTYTLTATTAQGCSATSTVTVTANPAPATPTITQAGATLTSSAATGNQWLLGGSVIPGATGATYTVTGPGTYTVVVTNATGCASSASLPLIVAGTRTGANISQLTVYPNPTTRNEVTLTLPGITGAAKLTLLNAVGQTVMSEQSLTLHNQPVLLHLPMLATGVYIVQLRMQDGTLYTRRLLRE
jgi:hypothetical protein